MEWSSLVWDAVIRAYERLMTSINYPCICGCPRRSHKITTYHFAKASIQSMFCDNCFPMYDEPGPSKEGCNEFRPDNLRYLEELSER